MTKKRKSSSSSTGGNKKQKDEKPQPKLPIALSNEHNSFVSASTRTGIRLVLDWVDDWKTLVQIGLTCRELYHLILNPKTQTVNTVWKNMHECVFDHNYAPETVYPFQDPSSDSFSWRNHFERCIKSKINMTRGDCFKMSFTFQAYDNYWSFKTYKYRIHRYAKAITRVLFWKNLFLAHATTATLEGDFRLFAVALDDSKVVQDLPDYAFGPIREHQDKGLRVINNGQLEILDLTKPIAVDFTREYEYIKGLPNRDIQHSGRYASVLTYQEGKTKVECYDIDSGALLRQFSIDTEKPTTSCTYRNTFCAVVGFGTYYLYDILNTQNDKVLHIELGTFEKGWDSSCYYYLYNSFIVTTLRSRVIVFDVQTAQFHSIPTPEFAQKYGELDSATCVESSKYAALYASSTKEFLVINLKNNCIHMRVTADELEQACIKDNMLFAAEPQRISVWNIDTKQLVWTINKKMDAENVPFYATGTRFYHLENTATHIRGTIFDFYYKDAEDFKARLEELGEETDNTKYEYLQGGQVKNKNSGMFEMFDVSYSYKLPQ